MMPNLLSSRRGFWPLVVFAVTLCSLWLLMALSAVAFADGGSTPAPTGISANVVYGVIVLSVLLGTVGGAIEHFATPGSSWYKAGVFLAKAGTDLFGLGKLLGGGGAAGAAKSIAFFVGAALLFGSQAACLSSAPIVPVTPANQAQVTSCQNTAALHDGVVIADFGLSAGTAGLASGAALAQDSGTKTTLSGIGIGVAGALAVGVAIAELTASNFTNSQCSVVVGPLPTASQSTAP